MHCIECAVLFNQWNKHSQMNNSTFLADTFLPYTQHSGHFGKVEIFLKGSLDSIPSPSPSVKIQITGGKVFLRCKGKTLLRVVNKLLKTKKFADITQQCFAFWEGEMKTYYLDNIWQFWPLWKGRSRSSITTSFFNNMFRNQD